MERRAFLRGLGGFSVTVGVPIRSVASAASSSGPYGPLDDAEANADGLVLPPGFSARVIGESGRLVPGTDHPWPPYPDGAATFPAEGGWIYVCNSEVFTPVGRGSVSALRFSADGEIVDAATVLAGTTGNCAGGPTPWGTWLSCEEVDGGEPLDADGRTAGLVWETDPTGERSPVARPAMGAFRHEAVAVDPIAGRLYLTEDQPDGRFYRFTPFEFPDLADGRLDVAVVDGDGTVRWRNITDPAGAEVPVRSQVPEATIFPGGEGIWYHEGVVFFTTKLDVRVHEVDVINDRHRVIYDASTVERPVLDAVDNVTVHAPSGDVFVAEDGSDPPELVVLSDDGSVSAFARLLGEQHRGSEITGPCFSPAGDRLYFSSQRGGSVAAGDVIPGLVGGIHDPADTAGITFEVVGPFRALPEVVADPTTTIAAQAEAPAPPPTDIQPLADDGSGGAGTGWLNPAVFVGSAAGLTTAWLVDRRRRRQRARDPQVSDHPPEGVDHG